MNPETHSHKIMFFGFFIAIVAIIIMILLYGVSKKNTLNGLNSTSNAPSVSPTVAKEGSLTLALDASSQKTVNGRLFLSIVANSNSHDVTGFDFLMSYDPTLVEITQVQSSDTDFQIVKKDGAGYIAVTGFKNPSSTKKHVLTAQSLLSIVAKPKVKGTAQFQILESKGKETSKFIDVSSNPFYPAVNTIAVEIQ